jgi:hypothetical protein
VGTSTTVLLGDSAFYSGAHGEMGRQEGDTGKRGARLPGTAAMCGRYGKASGAEVHEAAIARPYVALAVIIF